MGTSRGLQRVNFCEDGQGVPDREVLELVACISAFMTSYRHVMARIEAQNLHCCLQRSSPRSWQACTDDLERIFGLVFNLCSFVLREVDIESFLDPM